MKALRFERKPLRYAASMVAGTFVPGRGAAYGPLRLRDIDEPHLVGDEWVSLRPRLAGICGSDLATIDGRAARYFEPIVSFPFVPGHEVVADAPDGSRVTVEPVLGCVTRGIEPPCPACTNGDLGNCERIAFGALEPGLQTGYCCDTGGAWSETMLAHTVQLHDVPDTLSDEDAVMIEPTACGVHGAFVAGIADGSLTGATVAVIGAGTLGLTVVAALRHFGDAQEIIVGARYPQQKKFARELGATAVVDADEITRAVRRATGSLEIGRLGPEGLGATKRKTRLTGGADIVVDCVGSSASIAEALAMVRPRGRVVLVGMPATVDLELTGLWHKEISLVGAYAYGTEEVPERGRVRTFDLASELVAVAGLGRLVSALYPLDRYTDALEHAAQAGARGAVKIAFDLREESR